MKPDVPDASDGPDGAGSDGLDVAPGLLDVLEEATDKLVAAGPAAVRGPGSLVRLARARPRLEALFALAAAGFADSGEYLVDGARSAPAWLARHLGCPRAEAARLVRTGRRLGGLAVTAEAALSGKLSFDKAEAITRCDGARTHDQLVRDEGLLADQAGRLSFSEVVRVCAYWSQAADQDGAEESDASARERREVHLEESFGGTYLGRMTLDAVSGAIVVRELRRLEEELFLADWSAARARLGREPTQAELERSSAQRRADALVEMAARSASMPEGSIRPRPLFSVLVGYESLHGRICELEEGTVLAPGSILPWLASAELERAVFSPSGRVEVAERSRLFTGATRRALELRDRRCTHPFCEEPAWRCEADHVLAFAEGGPTTQENGALLCRWHNLLKEHERSRRARRARRSGAGAADDAGRAPPG